jgi:hypothetical protein
VRFTPAVLESKTITLRMTQYAAGEMDTRPTWTIHHEGSYAPGHEHEAYETFPVHEAAFTFTRADTAFTRADSGGWRIRSATVKLDAPRTIAVTIRDGGQHEDYDDAAMPLWLAELAVLAVQMTAETVSAAAANWTTDQ